MKLVVQAVSELPKEVEVVETVQSESAVSKPVVEEVVERVKVNLWPQRQKLQMS